MSNFLSIVAGGFAKNGSRPPLGYTGKSMGLLQGANFTKEEVKVIKKSLDGKALTEKEKQIVRDSFIRNQRK